MVLEDLHEIIQKIKIDKDIQDDLHIKIQSMENPTTDSVDDILGNDIVETDINIHINENVYHDLDIFADNGVFTKLNLCYTLYGQYYLRQVLLHPTINVSILTQRQNIIKSLVKSPQILTAISDQLKTLQNKESHIIWFWNQSSDINTIYEMVYFNSQFEWIDKAINSNQMVLQMLNFYKIFVYPSLTAFIPIITIIIPFILIKLMGKKIPIKLFLDILRKMFANVLGGNVMMSNKTKFTTLLCTGVWGFLYLQSIYSSCSSAYYTHKIINLLHSKVNYVAQIISIVNKISQISPTGKSPINDLTRLCGNEMFQNEPGWITNKGVILGTYFQINANIDLIKPYIKYVAEIDFYVSMAKLYKQQENTIEKLWYVKYLTNHKRPGIKVVGLWDVPLLGNGKKIVANDVNLMKVKNLIITGPNAGGKSTYIKSIAVGILMAQTIGLAPGKMRMTPFHLINTYLNIPDCIGKSSLFEAEMYRAKEHLDMITQLDGDKAFVIMDEIFSSTNYVEGFSAAYAIIKKLVSYKNSISIITTHYTDLTRLEKDTKNAIQNWKLTCEIKQDEKGVPYLKYPYKVERGISKQYVALEILKKNNFDPEIINEALKVSKIITMPKCGQIS